MNEFSPHTPPAEQPTSKGTHTKLPIALQLGILVLILGGMFSSLYFTGQQSQEEVQPLQELTEVPAPTPQVPQKISTVDITASSAFVWDVAEQRALFTKNETIAVPLASITKLMTTLLVHELLEKDNEVRVSAAAILQEGDSGLYAGEEFTIEQLELLSLISSSNDAAYTLGASLGALLGNNRPDSQFIQAMNIRADELNLPTLEFKNMTGLDITPTTPGAIGSAKDVSFLMEYIVTKYPELLAPTTNTFTRVYNADGEYHDVENTNEVVAQIPNVIGSKTGYTDLAGGNLTIAFDLGLNHPIIITVLGSTRQERFNDVLTLVEAVQKTTIEQSK